MQLLMKLFFIILLTMLLNHNHCYAQSIFNVSEQDNNQKITEQVLFKEPLQIDNKTLLYMGAPNQIEVKYRILQSKLAIENIINNAISNHIDSISIQFSKDNDSILINYKDFIIANITEEDIKVNKTEDEKLKEVWKYNIETFINSKIQIHKDNKLPKTDQTHIIIITAFIILVITIIILELIRNFILKYIAYGLSTVFNIFIEIIKQFKKTAILNISSEDLEIQKQVINERISVITNETKFFLNTIIKIIEVICVIFFTNYALYLFPVTNPFVADITHFELSILSLLKDIVSSWFNSRETWQSLSIIIAIIVIFSIIILAINSTFTFVEKIIDALIQGHRPREKRILTLFRIINTTITILLVTLGILLILSEVGVNVNPIIAGAGIMGLTISFGSQSIVKDIINGIFILFEDQFAIGDIIKINDKFGRVEDMTLRVTVLRHIHDGRVFIITNSQINDVEIYTKQFSKAHLDIGIAYKEDINKAWKIMEETATIMEKELSSLILSPATILGVSSLGDSSVSIKITFNTKPGKQWDVEREYLKRIKYAFDNSNIEIPFPHRTLYIPQNIGYNAENTEHVKE